MHGKMKKVEKLFMINRSLANEMTFSWGLHPFVLSVWCTLHLGKQKRERLEVNVTIAH